MIRGMKEILTPDLAASYLGVSRATIQNWLRSGLIDTLSRTSLDKLKEERFKGRLSHRANKQISTKLGLSINYGAVDSKNLNKVKETLDRLKNYSLEEILFFAVEDLISYHPRGENPYLISEMTQWETSLFKQAKRKQREATFPDTITSWQDFPGWLYQSLEREGSKSSKGAYFTPEAAAQIIVQELLPEGTKNTFFDPSCGTGRFLCLAALRLNDPVAVFGQDNDPLAVKLARINLMLLFPCKVFEPQIYQGDSLLAPHEKHKNRRFNSIGTNPPWGYRFTDQEKRALSLCFGSARLDSSSYFILAAVNYLQPEGKVGMLLPESLLHRQKHKEFREMILSKITKIVWFGSIFSGVQSECLAFFLTDSHSNCPVLIERNNRRDKRTRESFSKNPLGIWNIFTTPLQEKIFKKLFLRPHYTLKGNSRWGMGIVTGDNGEHLKTMTGKDLLPLVKGKDLYPFTPIQPDSYLNYHDHRLQQKAPLEDYLSPKILYRFIAPKPVLVMDNQGFLTLNSVNYLIPSLSYNWEILILLFNSSLYGLYFQKTFHTLKILRSQLEYLPLPFLNNEEKDNFTRLYPLLMENYDKYRDEWNDLVYRCFGITEEEREILERDL
jgi:SAM-dependent methyltransferase